MKIFHSFKKNVTVPKNAHVALTLLEKVFNLVFTWCRARPQAGQTQTLKGRLRIPWEKESPSRQRGWPPPPKTPTINRNFSSRFFLLMVLEKHTVRFGHWRIPQASLTKRKTKEVMSFVECQGSRNLPTEQRYCHGTYFKSIVSCHAEFSNSSQGAVIRVQKVSLF